MTQILKVFESYIQVKYLRRKGFKFIFPAIEEKYFIDKSDIETKLSLPEIESGTCRISQQYWFPTDFEEKYVRRSIRFGTKYLRYNNNYYSIIIFF